METSDLGFGRFSCKVRALSHLRWKRKCYYFVKNSLHWIRGKKKKRFLIGRIKMQNSSSLQLSLFFLPVCFFFFSKSFPTFRGVIGCCCFFFFFFFHENGFLN
jgi:hypothetical protein